MTEPIVIKDLTKDFNGFRAVDRLNLVVKKNSFTGFLGPNGAGKTTTIKILTNLLRATSGSAELNGIDVTKRPKQALASVGAVVETPEFYPYLTPERMLQYLGELRGMSSVDIKRRSKEVLEAVRMTEWADKKLGKFSKGMKQRVALAQAMLHEPSVIILDEPTSGLDPRGMVEMREVLNELKKEDYTVLMSSHLLNEVQDVCDDVVLVNRGKMLKSGPVNELVASNGSRNIEVKVRQRLTNEWTDRISKLGNVSHIKQSGEKVLVLSVAGSDDAQVELLRDLMKLDLDVISFKESGVALENLYMSLIKESR